MKSGPPICALRASVLRTSGRGSGGSAGWRTPMRKQVTYRKGSLVDSEGKPWLPGRRAYDERTGRQAQHTLIQEVEYLFGGWPTATVRDHKDGTRESCANVPENSLLGRVVHQVHGLAQSGGPAETASTAGFRLNPRFSLWLMGYPAEWGSCGERAMRLYRPVLRRSSSRSVR